MDELGFTKIAAAVLATGLGVMIIRTLPGLVDTTEYPAMPAYTVGPMEVADAGAEVDLPFPQADWVAAMDASKGARVFKKCQSCHNVEKGGNNGTGPNLWNVVGARPGSHDGFNYSSAMTGMLANWTYEELDAFLEKPSKYLSGTKMAFIGLKKAEDRAAVIEYLRVAADSPLAQPEPAAVETQDVIVPSDDTTVLETPAIEDPTDTPDDMEQVPTE